MQKSRQNLRNLLLFDQQVFQPAYERLRNAAASRSSPVEVLHSYGVILETGALLCIGVDIDYFSEEDVLQFLLRQEEIFAADGLAGGIPGGSRSRLIGNEWAEHLSNGYFREALGIRFFSDTRGLQHLHPQFVTALVLLSGFSQNQVALRFLREILLAEDGGWYAAVVQEAVSITKALKQTEEGPWGSLARTPLLMDGMLQTFNYLLRFESWYRDVKMGFRDNAGANDAQNVLALLVGRAQLWKLEPSDSRLAERLRQAIELADLGFTAVSNRADLGGEGFGAEMIRALEFLKEVSQAPLPEPEPAFAS